MVGWWRRRNDGSPAVAEGVQCRMCGWAVTADPSGRCPLGHRVAPPGALVPTPIASGSVVDPAPDSVVAGPDDARADALLEDLLDWEAPVAAERDEGTDAAYAGSGLEASLLSALDELETRVGALTGGEASAPRPTGGAAEVDVPTEPGQVETPAPGGPEVDGDAEGPTRPPRSLPWGTAG